MSQLALEDSIELVEESQLAIEDRGYYCMASAFSKTSEAIAVGYESSICPGCVLFLILC